MKMMRPLYLTRFIIFIASSLLMVQNVVAQDCNNNMIDYTPSQDFTIHPDGTITHKYSKLMWKVCSEGQIWSDYACIGSASTFTWLEALQHINGFNVGGGYATHLDWRMPNAKELQTLVEYRCSAPAINETAFPSTPFAPFWSNSPAVDNDKSWYVEFNTGQLNKALRTNSYHIRLVRDTL